MSALRHVQERRDRALDVAGPTVSANQREHMDDARLAFARSTGMGPPDRRLHSALRNLIAAVAGGTVIAIAPSGESVFSIQEVPD